MKQTELDITLSELEKEGRIKRTRDLISLND
jgi:hypothetical protein